jgi:hypothetical protein
MVADLVTVFWEPLAGCRKLCEIEEILTATGAFLYGSTSGLAHCGAIDNAKNSSGKSGVA